MRTLIILALVLAAGVGLFLWTGLERKPARGPQELATPPSSEVATDPARAPEATRNASEPVVLEEAEPPQRTTIEPGVAPARVRRFQGAVIGEGAPVIGAELALWSGENLLDEARTDQDGHFSLVCTTPASDLSVRIRSRGFVPLQRSLGARTEGGTDILGNLRLVRGSLLRGLVVDSAQRGIADADVSVEPRNSGTDSQRVHAKTGADGRFEVSDAPGGLVRVRAAAAGYGERTVEHAASPEGPELVIQLDPGSALSVRVSDVRSSPVAGAEVTIQATDPSASPRSGHSDEHGRCSFDGLGATTWNLRVMHPDYRPAGRGQVSANGVEIPIELVLWPAIEGVVRCPDGSAPPPGTQVFALPASAPSDRALPTTGGRTIAEDGNFRIPGLRPGDWTVQVRAPGYAPLRSAPVRLGPESDGWAGTLMLAAGGSLELKLVVAGQPVTRAEVELMSAPVTPAQLWALRHSGTKTATRVSSGPGGSAELRDLSPGEVWVAIYAQGSPPQQAGPFQIESGKPSIPTAIELERGGRLRGRVSDSDGNPISTAQVRITERGSKIGFPLTEVTNAEGRWSTDWIPAGRYDLEAFYPGDAERRAGPVEVDVPAGEERESNLSL